MLIQENAGWIRDLLDDEDPEKIKNYKEIVESTEKIEQHVKRAKGITQRMLGFGRRMVADLLEQQGFRADVKDDSLFAVAENFAADDILQKTRMTSNPPGNDFFIVHLGRSSGRISLAALEILRVTNRSLVNFAPVPHRHRNKTRLELEKGLRLIFFTFFEKNKKIK